MTRTAFRPDGEPERAPFPEAIERATVRVMSAATIVEASMVVLSRRGEDGLDALVMLLRDLRIEAAPLSADHARSAVDAFRWFGEGRHQGGLNFGDCLAYVLAQATGEPLLFTGGDFAQTDVERVL